MRRTLSAAMTILVLAAGCTGSDEPSGDRTTTPTPAATVQDGLVDYGDDGVAVVGQGDAQRLAKAPADFEAFIVDELGRQRSTRDEACTQEPEIRVERVDVDGWAAGVVNIPQCGANAALWARTDGAWRTVWSEQTLPDCSVLEKYDFPSRIAGRECGTADGRTRRYP